MFSTFEHTADLGLQAAAASLEELFVEAARGLMSMLVDRPENVLPTASRDFEISASELDYLFFDWLSELLFAFESEGWLGTAFDVRIDGHHLRATIRGEHLDRVRHQPGHEVKAITYHGLQVREVSDGSWTAEVIVDI